jgi:tetratricopeptide (TPR) repeat protein
MEHEEVLRVIAPLLLARCPSCFAAARELARQQEDVGHWDELVVVLEGQEAIEQLAELAELPFERQLEEVRQRDDLHTWGLCQALLKRSRQAVLSDPYRAIDDATLAVQVASHLSTAYDPAWVLDLEARTYAHLGNARRVLGELRSAEDAFRTAEWCLAQGGTGNRIVEAEIWDLKASLRRAQRRFDEALELLDRALDIYLNDPEEGDPHLAGRTLVNKSRTLANVGDFENAIVLVREAETLVDVNREPRLLLCLRHNQAFYLSELERFHEAADLLGSVWTLVRECGSELDNLRILWLHGQVELGLGNLAQAEKMLLRVQAEFLQKKMGFDAALVSLDLAVVYALQGNSQELKKLALAVLPLFEDREVHREALAMLLLFQRACEEERLTVSLARHLSTHLSRSRGSVFL